MRTTFEKPYLLLKGKPILAHTLLAIERSPLIRDIILLVGRSRIKLAQRLIRHFHLKKVIGIYPGGTTRFESVWQGLKRVPESSDFVLVHDGARPLLTQSLIHSVVKGAYRSGAAIPILPVSPTIKRGKGRFVQETLIREELWEVQTPQVFRTSDLLQGYEEERKGKKRVITDCAQVVERLKKKILMVPGDPRNIKITTKEELALSELLMGKKLSKPCAWG